MTSGVTVTSAKPHDAGAIAALYAEHVRRGVGTFETAPPGEDEMRVRIERVLGGGWPWLAARAGETLLGYAYAAPFHARAAWSYTCEDSIYVAAESRGLGIGSLLLAALIGEAAACGFRQMIAVIGGAEPASVALHARHGFNERGRLHAVGRKHGVWLDVVYMQRALGEGGLTMPPAEPG